MALIDVSSLITDPDFSDGFVLIKQDVVINQWGEQEITVITTNVSGSVQNISPEILNRFPEAAHFTGAITVWYRGQLQAQSTGGYCDVIIWNGYRYLVKIVVENFMNFASGWTSAICSKEVPSA